IIDFRDAPGRVTGAPPCAVPEEHLPLAGVKLLSLELRGQLVHVSLVAPSRLEIGGAEVRLRVIREAGKHARAMRSRVENEGAAARADVLARDPGADQVVVRIDV